MQMKTKDGKILKIKLVKSSTRTSRAVDVVIGQGSLQDMILGTIYDDGDFVYYKSNAILKLREF